MTSRIPVTDPHAARLRLNRPSALVALTKPRITVMVCVSAVAGMLLSGGDGATPLRILAALAGIALSAGGANALNQVWERDVDAQMERTRRRPLPSGIVTPGIASLFGLALVGLGVAELTWLVRPLTGLLAFLTVAIYVLAYTPLKAHSSLATVLGAIPGALPIVGGWTAGGGDLNAGAWALFGILFFWQLPHFLALAWIYKEDYRRGGLQMLPVEDETGIQTRQQTVLYALALLPTSLLPALLGLSGGTYALVAVLFTVIYLVAAVRFAWHANQVTARKLFRVSLLYLPILLGTLALDGRAAPMAAGTPAGMAEAASEVGWAAPAR